MDKQGWEIDNPVRAIDIRCHQYSQEPPMVDWPAALKPPAPSWQERR